MSVGTRPLDDTCHALISGSNSIRTPQGKTRVTHCYPDQTPSELPKRICASHLDQLYPDFPQEGTRGMHWHPDQTPSGLPKRICDALPLSGLPQGKAHDTRKHHIRTTDISYPDMFVRIVDWSKQVLLHHSDSLTQPTIRRLQSERTERVASHLRRSVACRTKGREWWQVPSHDLCQPPTGWWWPCHHLGVIMTNQKILSSLMREDELLTLYKGTFTQGRR